MKKNYRSVTYFILAVAAVGIYFFYTKMYTKEIRYYGYFDNVAGLENGSEVLLSGVKVGKVEAMDVAENNRVRITLLMQKNEQLPTGTVVKLVPGTGLLSGKNIQVIPGPGKELLLNEAVLPTRTDTTMVESVSAKITPLVTSAKLLLKGAESGLTYVNYFVRTGLTVKAVNTMIELDSNSRNLSAQAKKFNDKSVTITKGIDSLDSGTKRLAAKDASIDSTIHNTEKSTNSLAKKELKKNVTELQANIAKFNNSLKSSQAGKPDDMYPKLKNGIDSLKVKVKAMSDKGAKAAGEGN